MKTLIEGMHCGLPQMAQQCVVSWFLSCHTAENRALCTARIVLCLCCAMTATEQQLLLLLLSEAICDTCLNIC